MKSKRLGRFLHGRYAERPKEASRAAAGAFLLAVMVAAPPAHCELRTDRAPAPKRAPGVVRAKTYADALARARRGKRDIVVLVHGSDWCRIGEIFRKTVWEQREFHRRLGDGFVLFDADVPEHPTESQKKTLAMRQKGFKTKFGNYPVLVFIDPMGRRYAAVTGYATMTRDGFPSNMSQAVRTIRKLRRAREIRDYYLARAQKAPDAAKPELLFRAWQADAGLRDTILALAEKADPQNRTGFPARMGFDGYAVLWKAKEFEDSKKFEEGEQWLQERLAQKGVTPEQKQWVLTALGNLYRRWPGHDGAAYRVFMEAVRIDPYSIMGRAASRLALRFVGPPNLEFGWAPRHCRTTPTRWNVDPGTAISEPGAYRVVFLYRKGRSALHIDAIEVWDGNQKIVGTGVPGRIGPHKRRAEFILHVPRRMRHPVLRVTCHTSPKTNAAGDIRIEYAAGH